MRVLGMTDSFLAKKQTIAIANFAICLMVIFVYLANGVLNYKLFSEYIE